MENRITLVSNIIFEPYFRMYISKMLESFISNVQLIGIPYEELNECHDELQNATITIVCLNFDELYPDSLNDIMSGKLKSDDVKDDAIKRCKKLYSLIKENTCAKIVWFGFEDYYINNDIVCGAVPAMNAVVDRVNCAINDMLDGDVYIELKRLIAKISIHRAYDKKGKYRWNAPYSKELIELMASEVSKQYLIHTGRSKKCIVLDCDNVLWGGILSEVGIEGIYIGNSGTGRAYQDFQRFLLTMYYHGVILAVCSKNDESEVLHVFREHTGMLLKEENIACFQCNWNNKPDNVKAISDGLNLGLDSLVFVDDTVFEIEAVKSLLPEVTTILYQRDSIYDALSCFNLNRHSNLQTVRERMNTYKTNVMRYDLQKNSSSFEDYLSSLEMFVDIHVTMENELARISELTLRTNKCTNGIRYTLEQLEVKLSNESYELYTICLSDKFSDLGIVGTMGVEGENIDLFSLSCRALGRATEEKMVHWLLERHAKTVGFISTNKNEKLYNFFLSYGLKIINKKPDRS